MPENAAEDPGREPPGAAAPRWLRRLRPAPFELAAYGGALLADLFLRAHGLRFGWRGVGFVIQSVIGALPVIFAVGIVTQLVAEAAARRSPRAYLAEIASPAWLALWARLWLAGIAFAYTYTWLKVSIPLVRADLFDVELWRLDRALHFGLSPTILAVELTRGTVLPALLDRWYALWLPSIPFVFAFVTASVRSDLRRNFVLANCLLWTCGAWLYLAAPALGPCYASPELVAPIAGEMPRARKTQQALFAHYGKMIQSRGRRLDSFHPELGVAALPSLHVGAHWLFALWARRYRRRLFLPCAVATGLTFFGSLVTTWHYAIDGYAGMLLAWLVVRLADRIEPAVREELAAPAVPAPAEPGGGAPEPS